MPMRAVATMFCCFLAVGAAAEPAVLPFPDVRVRVTALRHTLLSSRSAGPVAAVHVRDGDRFAEGGLLAALDARQEEIQLARARAAWKRQDLFCRMTEELVELASKGELELELARADREHAEAEVRFMELQLEKTRLVAPFAGRVADVFVREGQFVSEGQPMLEILDDTTLALEFIVPSDWTRWLAPEREFAVTIEETGGRHRARLERLGGKVDPVSRSIKAYAVLLDASPDLMEGMNGEAMLAPPGPE